MEKKNKVSFGARLKESGRKFLVLLKRNPHIIPLLIFFVAYVLYTFKLTHISKTTAAINVANMGMFEFVIMLFSLLSFVCYLNAFPKRSKPNIVMIVLFVVMSVLVLLSNIGYQNCIKTGIEKHESHLTGIFAENITSAQSMLKWHMGIMIAGFVMLALLPLYSRLLKKINTSIEIEYSEDVGEIELSSEE